MAEPFLGQIMMAGFNYAPRGWAFCNGQLMSIAQNSALFALLGTTYGGDGQTTFGLPNLQSRVPIHFGQSPGLSSYALGENAGVEQVTLNITQMPTHNHSATVVIPSNTDEGTTTTPTGAVLAAGNQYAATANGALAAGSATVGTSGSNQPHTNIQPYLALNFCIALQGIFPSRS